MPTSNSIPAVGLQRGDDSSARGTGCEAYDLKRILTLLADQVADADKRHSEALAGLQKRLAHLDTTAGDLKSQLPQEMSPVLDRIQGGMAALSDQIAGQSAQRQQATTSYETASAADTASAPALRSAMAADALDAFARRSQAARNASHGHLDHFDVLDSTPHNVAPVDVTGIDNGPSDITWENSAVEALARHFDNGQDVASAALGEAAQPVPSRTTPPAVVLTAAAVLPSPVVRSTAAAPASSNAATADFASLHALAMTSEREWLEDRFSAIAGRLETSLKDIGSTGALQSIDARFTNLEAKLTQALQNTSATPQMSGLEGIENQVEELSAQLVSVQNHFSRLDTIELELRSLADRFRSDKITKLLEGGSDRTPDNDALAGVVASRVAQEMPRFETKLQALAESLSAEKLAGLMAKAAPTAPDAGIIARLVAEQLAQSMVKPADTTSGPAPQLEELRAMIESFVVEHRHEGEQTASMLDTMQQAMITLLDRLDAIEQGPAPQAATDVETEADADDEGHRAGQYGYDDATAAHRGHNQHPDPHATAHNHHVPDDQVAAPSYPEPGHAAAPQSRPEARPSIAYSDDGIAAAPPVASRRDDFISSARRAARMANEAPADDALHLEEANAPVGIAQKVRRQPDAKAARRPLSRVSMALLCLVAVGASFAVVKSTILAPSSKGQVEAPAPLPAVKAVPQTRTPADKALQQLDDADVIIDNDKKVPPATPRRSSIEGDNGGVLDRDYANAFAGGARSATPASQIQGQRQGEFTPAMSEFARQNLTGASLTPDRPAGAMAKSNDNLPLTIGPNSLRASAMKGDSSAEFEIGARFAEGRGVPQDLEQAMIWYQKSAAQGFAPAQYRLGSMYERGLGVKTDLARARVWYQRAAEQGIVKAMHNLAVLTAGRDANSTDYEIAAKWFKAAADHGLTDSQFNLAIMNDSGLGMPKDPKQAYKWFSIAARTGDAEASRRRESLRTKLMPQELTEIEAELSNWRPKSADQSVNDPRMAGETWKSRAP